MNVLKLVLVNFCVCALFVSVLQMIIPDKMKRILKVISSVALVAIIISPFLSVDTDELFGAFDFDAIEESENKQNALVHTSRLMEQEIYKNVESTLINCGVNEYEIYITTECFEESNEIALIKVEVLVGSEFESKINMIKEALSSEYSEVLKVGVKENGE